MSHLSSILSSSLSRYEIQERLGSGGMATVFKAVDTNLGREVAIKVLHEHLVHEATFRERFEQEAKFIASFNHPNIVQVYDFDMIDTGNERFYYMVMPFIIGSSLLALLNIQREHEETLAHQQVLKIIQDLASALDYAHQLGMVHRDVKPANILFDEHNRAILTDFGIARLAVPQQGLTQEGMIVGTPVYMSPEQAIGGQVDHRSDIYALGIIVYELLTGRPPFEDEGAVSILVKHANESPPPVSEFMHMPDPDLDSILEKALAKNPDERYQTAQAFAQALERVINNESTDERSQPGTILITANTPPRPTLNIPSGVIQTINTSIIRPAKKNPLAFASLGIAIVTLLIVARFIQNSPTQAAATTSSNLSRVDSMTSETPYFVSTFEANDPSLSLWEQSSTASIERNIEDGQYLISNSAERSAVASLFNPSHAYGNLNISMEAQLAPTSSDAASGYGIVFRYQDSDNYNVFAIDGEGRFSIWTRAAGSWRELRSANEEWTPHEAVKPFGEMNQIVLNVQNDTITGFVNGQQVVSLQESTFDSGAVGVYMATTRQGFASVVVDNYSIQPDTASSDSMTDDNNSTDSMTDDGS